MRYFVIVIKVIYLLHILPLTNATSIEGRLPNINVIADFINKFLKPYIKPGDPPRKISHVGFRSGKETYIQDVIRKKIIELKPFLNDDESNKIESDEKLTLDGSEETTIIEFTPNSKKIKDAGRNRKETKTDTFKADIQVYKKLREKIDKALKKEPVSSKTAKLVTKAFDGLIAKLIGNQCMWKSVDNTQRTFRFRKMDEDDLLKMHNITKEEWENFKLQYAKLTQNKFVNETLGLFNKMQGFFSRIINETQTLSKRYKVQCQLVSVSNETKAHIRRNNDIDKCTDFKICSNELAIFMTDFYNSLNDTAVSTIRNYAAMYARDVANDMHFEKDSVIDLINNISNKVERKVNRIFAKETENIKLDAHKNKNNNIKILIRYINSTTGHVKKHIKKHLEKYLKSLRARLLLNVKQDIDVNLSVELGNLARDFTSRICTVFDRCNGKYSSRRDSKSLHTGGSRNNNAGKGVYVKVQLTFDEELKNILVRDRKKIMDSVSGNNVKTRTKTRNVIKNKYSQINITRTTHDVITTKRIKKVGNLNGQNPEGTDIFKEMKPIGMMT